MSPNEARVLRALSSRTEPVRLSEIGAGRNSHHTVTAARCERMRWAARVNLRPHAQRPLWGYTITDEGKQALANNDTSMALKGGKR